MKNNNKSIWQFVLMLLAIIAAAIIINLLMKSCGGREGAGTGQNPDSLIYWKNKAGELTTSLWGAATDFAIMEEVYKDSIAKVYATKTKYIKEIVEIKTKLDTELKPVGKPETEVGPGVDDCPPCPVAMSQKFKNKFYEADVRIGKGGYMRLTGTDSLIAVWKQVKQDKKTYLQLDITNANPDVKITGVKAFRYEQPKVKQKKWSLGIQGGYGMTLDNSVVKLAPYLGLGINYSIIRF